MASVSLGKGANVPVDAPAIRVELVRTADPRVPDTDVSALLLADDGRVRSDADMIFHNQPEHPSGAVIHLGKRGEGTGGGGGLGVRVESVQVDTARLEPAVERVMFCASVDGGTFASVPDLRLRLLDSANGTELAHFAMTTATTETAMVGGELYRRGDGWKFRAIGQGYDRGLAGLARDYGIDVADEPGADGTTGRGGPGGPGAASGAGRPTPAPAGRPEVSGPGARFAPAGPVGSPPPAVPTGPAVPPPGPGPGGPPGTVPPPPPGGGGPIAPGPNPYQPHGPHRPVPPPARTPPPAPLGAPGAPPLPPPGIPGVPAPATGAGFGPGPGGGGEQLPPDMGKRLSLRKRQVAISLEKRGARDVRARVILVLDASGSMSALYAGGTVAGVVERMAAVAAQLDDDGGMRAWTFASSPARLPDLRLAELAEWLRLHVRVGQMSMFGRPRKRPRGLDDRQVDMRTVGIQNEEQKVIAEVRAQVRNEPSPLPTLVLFFSDGGVYRNAEIERELREAVEEPIFWQFVGLGRSNYGVLERLDTLTGRRVDNVGFFAVDDIDRVTDAELYDRLLSEFPAWLTAARRAGILR